MDSNKPDIILIGCGKMGSALLESWLNNKIINSATTIDPNKINIKYNQDDTKIYQYNDLTKATQKINNSDCVILAVKPQIMNNICEKLAPIINNSSLLLSIAAGQKISNFEKYFGKSQPIIRTMPNTPAAIGAGITAAIQNNQLSDKHIDISEKLLSSVGEVVWLENESQMDIVTAISGSGPAYIFLLIETLTNCGKKLGLPSEIAEKLSKHTVIGASLLAKKEIDIPASTLRENVTSKGGTTQAALEILMSENGMGKIFEKAIKAAAARSKELSK